MPPVEERFSVEDEKLLDRLAELTVRHRMTVPAILLLESVKPLSFLGSQALHFFEPMVRAFFSLPDYDRAAALLERRESIEALLVRIEAQDETVRHDEREANARRREARRAEKTRSKTGKAPPEPGTESPETGTDRKEPM